jgi:hypothetical protein
MPDHPRTRWRLRIRVAVRRQRLTEALAEGADPGDSVELAMLAERLLRRRTRLDLTAGISRLLRRYSEAPRPARPVVPVNRGAVASVRDELVALADLLRDPAPIPVQTVALAAALLQNGAGPLYDRRAGDAPLLQRLAALPAPSHLYGHRFDRTA